MQWQKDIGTSVATKNLTTIFDETIPVGCLTED
jgi:hypothetical protein